MLRDLLIARKYGRHLRLIIAIVGRCCCYVVTITMATSNPITMKSILHQTKLQTASGEKLSYVGQDSVGMMSSSSLVIAYTNIQYTWILNSLMLSKIIIFITIVICTYHGKDERDGGDDVHEGVRQVVGRTSLQHVPRLAKNLRICERRALSPCWRLSTATPWCRLARCR